MNQKELMKIHWGWESSSLESSGSESSENSSILEEYRPPPLHINVTNVVVINNQNKEKKEKRLVCKNATTSNVEKKCECPTSSKDLHKTYSYERKPGKKRKPDFLPNLTSDVSYKKSGQFNNNEVQENFQPKKLPKSRSIGNISCATLDSNSLEFPISSVIYYNSNLKQNVQSGTADGGTRKNRLDLDYDKKKVDSVSKHTVFKEKKGFEERKSKVNKYDDNFGKFKEQTQNKIKGGEKNQAVAAEILAKIANTKDSRFFENYSTQHTVEKTTEMFIEKERQKNTDVPKSRKTLQENINKIETSSSILKFSYANDPLSAYNNTSVFSQVQSTQSKKHQCTKKEVFYDVVSNNKNLKFIPSQKTNLVVKKDSNFKSTILKPIKETTIQNIEKPESTISKELYGDKTNNKKVINQNWSKTFLKENTTPRGPKQNKKTHTQEQITQGKTLEYATTLNLNPINFNEIGLFDNIFDNYESKEIRSYSQEKNQPIPPANKTLKNVNLKLKNSSNRDTQIIHKTIDNDAINADKIMCIENYFDTDEFPSVPTNVLRGSRWDNCSNRTQRIDKTIDNDAIYTDKIILIENYFGTDEFADIRNINILSRSRRGRISPVLEAVESLEEEEINALERKKKKAPTSAVKNAWRLFCDFFSTFT